jgi:hypothetical protein
MAPVGELFAFLDFLDVLWSHGSCILGRPVHFESAGTMLNLKRIIAAWRS